MSRAITLSDSSGAVVSILEIPEHASPAQTHRIASAAAALATARGLTATERPALGWIAVALPNEADRFHVCRCQSGGACDVPHDPGACDCRQCVTAEAFASDGSP